MESKLVIAAMFTVVVSSGCIHGGSADASVEVVKAPEMGTANSTTFQVRVKNSNSSATEFELVFEVPEEERGTYYVGRRSESPVVHSFETPGVYSNSFRVTRLDMDGNQAPLRIELYRAPRSSNSTPIDTATTTVKMADR